MAEFAVRAASAAEARAMAELFAAVAEERDGVASEPPVDVAERAALFAATIVGTVVAVADSKVIGLLHVGATRYGFGEVGMCVAPDWRGRGVGSALMRAGIIVARGQGLHKLCLEVFPHNTAALALYRRFGFVEEGRRIRQYRRASGDLWDSVIMGLPLLPASRALPEGGRDAPRFRGSTWSTRLPLGSLPRNQQSLRSHGQHR
jgi:ribosomal protein S18 acetylase RimI-like enzyme